MSVATASLDPLRVPLPSQEIALEYFDSLETVPPKELVGLWEGKGIPTGHPLDGVLENLGWYGKRFNANMRADALLFQTGGYRLVPIDPAYIPVRLLLRFAQFARTKPARNCFGHLQKALWARGPVASLKALQHRGRTSAAMVYDHQPVIDHFRKIDDGRLLGAMSIKGDDRCYFFLLSRTLPADERAL
ncbi:DUF4334 domain-containing protein [Rhizobium sp. LCM 4573]|uniref:DUF4334 domain-containing protein n=1 Tax=Rhizobium sp. LCM 4573 TaxID=1848291 RepID=UPI0008D9B755|nr:DUF4334 domain-containing protein [Rhizobium sp. LCM 4573]OHV77100.1 hypothetical protein LCM4573_10040 [Rhizobium sp. LCM 4573]